MKYAEILGVYEHIQPISEKPREPVTTYHQIAAMIDKKDASEWERLRKHHVEGNLKFDLLIHRLMGERESHSTVKAIKNLFPIHPYSAYLIKFITQHCSSIERILLHVLHDLEHGFSKFIQESLNHEPNYFFTADYLWDSLKKFFERSEDLELQPLVKKYELSLSAFEKTAPQYQAVFKGILLLNTLSQFAPKEHMKELVFPSAENITAMFIGTPLEQSLSDILLSLCTDEFITKTDDSRFVVNASTSSVDVATIQEQSMKDPDGFTNWVQTLPFPLASILWSYHARNKDDDTGCCEILLHFFEALAEFYAVVLLSAFQNDRSLYANDVKEGIIKALAKNHQGLAKSSFGTWVTIVASLSKFARTLWNSKREERIKCEELFGTSDKNILNMLFNRRLIKELQQTNSYRNSWSGHRGAINKKIAHERLMLLETHLLTLQSIFSETWKNFYLIRPGELRYEGNCYKQEVEVLSGYTTPFQHRWLETRQPMIYDSLYFFSHADMASLQVLPLMKVIPSPKTQVEACYFYNRTEGNKLRFISYHFEPEPEIYEDSSQEISPIIRELQPQEKSDENISNA